MVSNATREVIFEVVDANIAYNSKLFILIIILAYSIAGLYFSYRIFPKNAKPLDYPLSDVVRGAAMRFSSSVIILLYPLLSIFLFRGFSLSAMQNLLWAFYGIVFAIVMIYGFIFGWEKFMEFFGLNAFSRRYKTRRPTRK